MISLSRALRPDADAALVARPGTAATQPFSVTVERFGNVMRASPYIYGPSITRVVGVATGVSGDRALIRRTSGFGRFVNGYFNGGAVRVYRIVNDEMVLIREDTVAAWHARFREALPGGAYIPASTTVWRWAPGQFHRPSALVRFAVSTIAADGRVSPISNVVTYTTPAASVAQSVSNAATTGITIGAENAALGVPTNVAATSENSGRSVAITWDAVPDALGYVVWRTQYDFADLLQDAVDLVGGAGKEPMQAGDMLIFERRLAAMTTRASCTTDPKFYVFGDNPPPTDWGWAEDRPSDVLVSMSDPIEGPYLRATIATNRAQTFASSGGTEQTWYDVLDPTKVYVVTIRARGASGGETITLTRHGITRTVTLTTQWADHTVTWQPPSLNTTANLDLTTVTFVAPATLDIAWMAHHRADVPLTALLPEDVQLLADFGTPSFVRLHQFCKTEPWTYDLDEITSRQGRNTRSLPQQLDLILQAGSQPWLQIEWVWTDAELLGLAEYLFASYDPGIDTPAAKPWAYRRHVMGRTAPWIDTFSEMWLEPGNENWNSVSTFYLTVPMAGATSAQANALILDLIARTIKSSPYWTPAVAAKFKFVLGGWRPAHGAAENWTQNNAATSLEADIIVHQDYIGGSDANLVAPWQSESAADWEAAVGNVVRNGTLSTVNKMIGYVAAPNVNRTKPNMLFGTYEGGPGEILGTLALNIRQSEQRVLKSHGMGTAVLDQFLLNAAKGHAVQTLFYYGLGFDWASHSHPSAGALPAPGTIYLSLLNRELFPARVRDVSPLFRPTGVISSVAGDLLSVYRIDGENGAVGLAICNRDTTAAHNVTARMSGLPATGTLTRYHLSGDYDDNNTTLATANDVALVTEALPYATTVVATIPVGSAHLYIWRQA